MKQKKRSVRTREFSGPLKKTGTDNFRWENTRRSAVSHAQSRRLKMETQRLLTSNCQPPTANRQRPTAKPHPSLASPAPAAQGKAVLRMKSCGVFYRGLQKQQLPLFPWTPRRKKPAAPCSATASG